MQKKKKILLLSNYRKDRQFSMLQFGEIMLGNSGHYENLPIKEIFPLPLFGKLPLPTKLTKWASYIDKFLIFPKRLTKYLEQNQSIALVHVIDQSNSPYLKTVRKSSLSKRLITCHDLIAVRTALGNFPTATKTSATGKRLQKWILDSLPLADFYACDSEQTKKDLNRIVSKSSKYSKVIHLGTERSSDHQANSNNLNPDLYFDPSEINYILHVGSAAWYKNRTAVFTSFLHAKNQPNKKDLKLILVGPTPQPHEMNAELSCSLNKHSKDVICLENISDEALSALYIDANLLLFPSFIEGFGWPPLEAASVNCQVISTKTGAINELLNKYANFVDSNNQQSINQTVIKVLAEKRKEIKVSLPSIEDCRKNYFQLYMDLLKN